MFFAVFFSALSVSDCSVKGTATSPSFEFCKEEGPDHLKLEPRGFAFVQFVDPYDASEAQYHMNRQIFAGREISVVVAAETRKRPEEMRHRTRTRGPGSYGGRRSSHYGNIILKFNF